jgi:EAL domain-containing protein (putative c-di-GMP-specific phosphodiesterase class I)
MNIQVQGCGMAILLTLLFFFLSQKKVGLYTERIFLATLVITLVSVGLDIGSVVAITFDTVIPEILLNLICKSYIVSLIWVGCSAFTYVLTDLCTEKQYIRYMRYVGVILAVESVIIYCLPIQHYHEGGVIYTYGSSVVMTYVFALIFVIAAFYCMFRYRHRVMPRRRFAVIVWMGLWMLAAAVQFFNNEYLLVGFACSLGIMMLFFILENPETNIDREMGCFHAHALNAYLKQSFDRKENIGILLISMTGYQPADVTYDDINWAIRELIAYLGGFKNIKVFKNLGQELVVLFPNMSQLAGVYQQIQDEFYKDQFYEKRAKDGKYQFPRTLFLLIPESRILDNLDEVIQLFQHVKMEERNHENTYVCYVNEMILGQMRKKEHMKSDILRALEEDRVEVFYQPIYSTLEKHIVSAEALARIRNADGSIMPPGEFIPVAEETGLIASLGERVFEKVCVFLKDSSALQLGIHYIEVNLSVAQCDQKDLAERYIRIMEQNQIDPWWINLEITETASVQAKNTLLKNMKELIDFGVSFSLDDFGNGQSNLDYIIDMPVSIMKLDMNMIRSYFVDLKARFVVQAAIRMAHDMDLMVVAEGVETKEQLDTMVEEKIDYIQGYYFSKPLPADEFIAYLEKHQDGFVDK